MITGTVVVFIAHVFSISISRSLYFVSFSIIFKEVFLSVGIDISISRQVLSFLSLSYYYNYYYYYYYNYYYLNIIITIVIIIIIPFFSHFFHFKGQV